MDSAPGGVALAFDLAGIGNTAGCPVLRVLGEGLRGTWPD
jgi:hypothetical protein